MYGTDGTQDTPRKWEGFGEYKLVYRLRNEGLDYLGNDTVVRTYTYTHDTRAHMCLFEEAANYPFNYMFPTLPWFVCLVPGTERGQVILKGEHLLQFHMARDSSDAALQYPTRYVAEDNFTLDVDIRLNRYIAQTQASMGVND